RHLPTLPFLFGFEGSIRAVRLLLRVMNGASGIGADLVDFALAVAIRDDGLGGELAGLVLRPLRLFLVLRLLRRDSDVLATRHDSASLRRFRVACADLH